MIHTVTLNYTQHTEHTHTKHTHKRRMKEFVIIVRKGPRGRLEMRV